MSAFNASRAVILMSRLGMGFAELLGVTQQATLKRLKAMGMIKVGPMLQNR